MSQAEPAVGRLRRPGRTGMAIALVAVLALGAAVGFVSLGIARERAIRDAFPMVAGQLRVEGLGERVAIDRDDRGIPHVLGNRESDAWFGLGFAHAQDRLGQMLWLRRVALGRTAERIGEVGLPTDRRVRTLGFPRIAEQEAAELGGDTLALLEAYALGINARMARIQAGRVASPVVLRDDEPLIGWPGSGRGTDPEPGPALAEDPWRVADSLAIGKLVAWGAGASLERAVVLSDLIERLGSMGARPFFPGGESELGLAVPLDDPDHLSPSEARAELSDTLLGLASWRASAWALPGRFTVSGAPILVAELSVAPTAPSLLYQAHVRGGTLDAAGVTIPGIPIFWAGRNPDVTWAATPVPVATVDLFKESLRRGAPPARDDGPVRPAANPPDPPRPTLLFQNGSRWVPVSERLEEIVVGLPGTSEHRVEQLRVRETRHGPLINGLFRDGVSRAPLALSWTGARLGDSISGMLRLARARSAAEVRAALALHGEPPLEVIYADREGRVGLQVAGWLPQRTLPSGLSPVPGRLRAFDWRARIAAEALPHQEIAGDAESFDPRSGWIVSSGAQLEEELSGAHIEWLWPNRARSRRLRAMVAELVEAGGVDLRAASALQADISANADPQLLAALLRLAGSPPELSPEGQEVADLLRHWDGVAGTDSRGAVAFQLLIGHLLQEILEPTIGAELMDRYLALPNVEATALLQSIVVAAARAGRAGGWTDPDVVGEAVRESLRRTWMSLSYRLGHNRERWTWGRLHSVVFSPFEGTWATGIADASIGPFPMPGQAASVARAVPDRETFATRRVSTYRMAVDLASPDRMLTSLAPGQSEHPGHAHFADGVAPWRGGRPSLLVTSPFQLEQAAVEKLVLEPSK